MRNLILDKKGIVSLGIIMYMFRMYIIMMNVPKYGIITESLWYGMIFCCIMGIIMSGKNEIGHLLAIAILGFMFANYRISGSWQLISTFLLIYASVDIDFRYMIRLMFNISAPILVIDVVWYLINYLVGNVQLVHSRSVDGSIVYRHTFYFSHENSFSFFVLFTAFMFVYLYYDKIEKRKIYAILLCIAAFIYIFPNSRTTSLMFIIYILFDMKKPQKIQKGIYIFCKYSFLVSLVIVTILVYLLLLDSKQVVAAAVNKFLNGRLSMVAAAYILYGLKPLGSFVANEGVYLPTLGSLALFLDNFYGMLFIRFGLICAGIVTYVSLRTSSILYQNKRYKELVLFTMVFIFGLSEGTPMTLFPAFQWLFVRDTLFFNEENRVFGK